MLHILNKLKLWWLSKLSLKLVLIHSDNHSTNNVSSIFSIDHFILFYFKVQLLEDMFCINFKRSCTIYFVIIFHNCKATNLNFVRQMNLKYILFKNSKHSYFVTVLLMTFNKVTAFDAVTATLIVNHNVGLLRSVQIPTRKIQTLLTPTPAR